jgi:hypothetical protein
MRFVGVKCIPIPDEPTNVDIDVTDEVAEPLFQRVTGVVFNGISINGLLAMNRLIVL